MKLVKKSLMVTALSLCLASIGGVASAGSVCEGDQKTEGDGPHTYAPGGPISEVCIKAGRNAYVATCGETDPTGNMCYQLDWASDCTSVRISGGGTGRDCKGISHTAADFDKKPPPPCDGKDCPK